MENPEDFIRLYGRNPAYWPRRYAEQYQDPDIMQEITRQMLQRRAPSKDYSDYLTTPGAELDSLIPREGGFEAGIIPNGAQPMGSEFDEEKLQELLNQTLRGSRTGG